MEIDIQENINQNQTASYTSRVMNSAIWKSYLLVHLI